MKKAGRPKQVLDYEPMLQRDTIVDSLKPKINHVSYQHHLNSVKRERLEKGLKQLFELAFNERLPDTKAKALAIELGGNK